MNLCDTYPRKYRKTKLEIDHSKYKRQRNKVTNMIKSCKQNFSKNLLTENVHDPKKFWKSLKKIYPTKTQNHSSNSTFTVNNVPVKDPKVIKWVWEILFYSGPQFA